MKEFIRNCSIIILVLTPLFIISKCRGDILKKEGIEGIGKIVDIRRTTKGKTTRKTIVLIEYYHEGEKFVSTRTRTTDINIGDCFEIIYVPKNPVNMSIDFNEKVNCSKKKR